MYMQGDLTLAFAWIDECTIEVTNLPTSTNGEDTGSCLAVTSAAAVIGVSRSDKVHAYFMAVT